MKNKDTLTVGLAQISPVWLNQQQTKNKVIDFIKEAASNNCDLVCFGEALLPGYPYWLELTDGARFNSQVQKELHSHYMSQAINIEKGDLDAICNACSESKINLVLGCIERAENRGGHSLYCSAVQIDDKGKIQNVHRKLQPTYEERLSWSPGDGHGLKTRSIGAFELGVLNCWENWMPMVRSALYAQGENLHVAIWPGGMHNTHDITRMIAKESRSFVISVSGLLTLEDIPKDLPHFDLVTKEADKLRADGGSCIAGPNGEWIIEPVKDKEGLLIAEINHARVREERQNFDPSGHYSRPDVLKLHLNTERQSVLETTDKGFN